MYYLEFINFKIIPLKVNQNTKKAIFDYLKLLLLFLFD